VVIKNIGKRMRDENGQRIPLETRTRANQGHFALPTFAQQDLIIAMGKLLLCISLYSILWMTVLIEVILSFSHYCLTYVGRSK
jgi:hypothetical protein